MYVYVDYVCIYIRYVCVYVGMHYACLYDVCVVQLNCA